MHIKIEYITDKSGKHKKVIIPAKQWDALESDYVNTKNKLRILLGIQNALKEVKDIQNGRKKAKTLSELLREL